MTAKKEFWKTSEINKESRERLKSELLQKKGFNSYTEIQTWLKAVEGIEASYKVVHDTVRSAFLALEQSAQIGTEAQKSNSINFSSHQQWNHESGWKNILNNLRLIIQPLFLFWLIFPWLDVFPNANLLLGFNHLIRTMNQFKPVLFSG